MDFNIRDRRAIFDLAKGWDSGPSPLRRVLQWLDDARINGNRKVLGLVIGGGAVASLGLGLLLGGALEGVDVALPPPSHPGPGPIIDYAAPTTAPRPHQHANRPTTAAGKSSTSTSTTVNSTTPPDSTTSTAVLTGSSSTTPTTTAPSNPPGSTTTQPPSTPTTTTPPPSGGGGGGGSPNNPLQTFLQQLMGG